MLEEVWICEQLLADPDPANRHRFLDLEESLLPALARGWIVANSDTEGRVLYRMTTAGWGVIDGPPLARPRTTPAPDPAAATVYDERVKQVIARLGTAKPLHPNEIGPPCVPVAYLGVPIFGEFRDAKPA